MRWPVAREGLPFIATAGAIMAAAGAAVLATRTPWWVIFVPGVFLLLVVWFFRDPERSTPGGDSDVVAPADGRVMWVRELAEPRFIKGPALAVSIFLSVFDVHINRAPVGGEVTYRDYVPGQFLAAWGTQVHEVNERAYVGLSGAGYRVLVVQIAGLLARRIVTWPRVGARLCRGERFGLIKFGSCTQVYLPVDAMVSVRPGQRVVGGQTIIGRLPEQ